MARFLIVGGFLAAVFWIFSVVDCAVQPPTRHRGVRKGVWIAIVALLPVIGGILWFALGRARPGEEPRDLYVPLDDDPSHLRRISEAEQDQRIRELEAELAKLDDDHPKENGSSGERS
ncbi:PLDc N-terminal domain-containing protein [Microbacterium sp. YY-01]|uniref:PLD nuclease N-terminal domain-containing protein n=1 Tax=Microbacterium sp. YY-01 TaxID=3421634 RepID=UPI003D182ED6